MKDDHEEIFFSLFHLVYQKGFGNKLKLPMSETESKHLAGKILEETGLVIGSKSIKNYSVYVLEIKNSKKENPSIATLDTLARYVLNAPYTDELTRKAKEGNFPYWFSFKLEQGIATNEKDLSPTKVSGYLSKNQRSSKKLLPGIIVVTLAISLLLALFLKSYHSGPGNFIESFNTTETDSLKKSGWIVQNSVEPWWGLRNVNPGHLTLYTLSGDNWPDTVQQPAIRNLLIRSVKEKCFSTEIHLDNFLPLHNWQQAGILLMEDSVITARCLRVSVSYNDYFGGYKRSPEIIIQVVGTNGSDRTKPEEIAHVNLYSLTPGEESLVKQNLQKIAIRIEKNNNRIRILYATGSMENSAFKEAFSKEIDLNPHWMGLFALQGFVNNQDYLPVAFKNFIFTGMRCGN